MTLDLAEIPLAKRPARTVLLVGEGLGEVQGGFEYLFRSEGG